MNRHLKVIILLLPLALLLTGCFSKNPKQAYISQVLNHPDSIQNGAVYALQDKELTVFKRYVLLSNPNNQSPEALTEDIKAEIERENQYLKAEFPEKSLNQDEFEQQFELVVKKAKIKINNNKREVTLIGKDYKKTFKMIKDNNFRLVDDVGIEYELKLD